jgi:fatty acid desaturase
MFLKLRVIFTILSAICIAAIFPVGIFWDFVPAVICALAAGLFFFIMLFCKKQQEKQENPPQEQNDADFFHPKTTEQNSNSTKSA